MSEGEGVSHLSSMRREVCRIRAYLFIYSFAPVDNKRWQIRGSLNNNLIRLALGFEFLIKIKMECSKSRNIIGDGDDENEEDILLGPIL